MGYVDLNCDMGESFGTYKLGYDEEAMPYVTSINVACGFHASDPLNMLKTIELAKKFGVAVGAHPSYPDLVGFGRRNMDLTAEEIKADLFYQIGALDGICRIYGVKLQHVKVHGALYNTAGKNLKTAIAIAEAIKAYDPNLFMLCLANSMMVEAAKQVGTKYVEESFADRAYMSDGSLAPRNQKGAVIHDVAEVVERVLVMARDKTVKTIDGQEITLAAQTICVHGDTNGALEMIKSIRKKLEEAGLEFKAFGEVE